MQISVFKVVVCGLLCPKREKPSLGGGGEGGVAGTECGGRRAWPAPRRPPGPTPRGPAPSGAPFAVVSASAVRGAGAGGRVTGPALGWLCTAAAFHRQTFFHVNEGHISLAEMNGKPPPRRITTPHVPLVSDRVLGRAGVCRSTRGGCCVLVAGGGGGNGRHVLRGERHVDAAAPPLRCPQVDLVGPCFEAAVTENILVKC